MTIKSELVEYVRTLVRDDHEANIRYEEKLDEEGWDGWPAFLGALFFLTLQRRFSGGYDETEAIRLVADLRARTSNGGPVIDPASAELLIKAVFDPAVQVDLQPETLGHIETMAVYAILSEENLPDAALEALLTEARTVAGEHS